MSRPKSLYYPDPNDACFRKHFKKLVAQHGGEWVVIADGEIVAVGPEERVSEMRQKARDLHPDDTPLVSPVPTPEDIECILSYPHAPRLSGSPLLRFGGLEGRRW